MGNVLQHSKYIADTLMIAIMTNHDIIRRWDQCREMYFIVLHGPPRWSSSGEKTTDLNICDFSIQVSAFPRKKYMSQSEIEFIWVTKSVNSLYILKLELANIFYKGPDGKQFRLHHNLWCTYWALPLQHRSDYMTETVCEAGPDK